MGRKADGQRHIINRNIHAGLQVDYRGLHKLFAKCIGIHMFISLKIAHLVFN